AIVAWFPSPSGLGYAELQFSGLAGIAAAASAAAWSRTATCGVFPLGGIADAARWHRSIGTSVKPCRCWRSKNSSEPTVLSTTDHYATDKVVVSADCQGHCRLENWGRDSHEF